MSKVIYKQRCNSPNRPNTPPRNINHIRYIATRPGAVTNYNDMFGAFGRMQDMQQAGQIGDLHGLLSYVRHKSMEKTSMYHAVISLREDDALALGLARRKDWEVMVEREMETIAKYMRIPLSRLEWVASVHMEPDHPHVHIAYWDKEQETGNYFVKPALVNEIRKQLIKGIFSEELDALYALREDAHKGVKNSLDGVLAELQRSALSMSEAEIVRYSQRFKGASLDYLPGAILNARSLGNQSAKTVEMLRALCADLPTSGRIAYGLMPPEIKAQADALARHILKGNVQCAKALAGSNRCSRDIAALYSANPENHDRMETIGQNRLLKEVANGVLKAAKGINTVERAQEYAAYEDAKWRQGLFDTVNAVFGILSRREQQQHMRMGEAQRELSEQAKRERALRKQIEGMDWGQER